MYEIERYQPNTEVDPFIDMVEWASVQLLEEFERDSKQLDKYERAKNMCGCRKCTAQFDRLVAELAEKWRIPNEMVLMVADSEKKRRRRR